MQEKQRQDALSIGEEAARAKYNNALAKLNSLQTRREIDDFEKSLSGSRGLPYLNDDEISDEEYDRQFTRPEETFGQPVVENPQRPQKTRGQIEKEEVEKEAGQPSRPAPQNASPIEKAGQAPAPAPEQKTSAKEEVPGGPARRRLWPRRNRTNNTNTTDSQVPQQNRGNASNNSRNQLLNRAQEAAKKYAQAAYKKVALALATNPWTWIIILITVIIAIILFVLGLSLIGIFSNNKVPSANGGTTPAYVDSKNSSDRKALNTLMKLTGNDTFAEEEINETLNNVKEHINNIKNDPAVAADQTISKKADVALAQLEVLRSNKTTDNSIKFIALVKELYDLIEDVAPVYTGQTRLPVETTSFTFNNDLHGYSFLRPDPVDNHNVYIRDERNSEKCDAVDIGTTIGDPVYPIFGGKIVDISNDSDNGNSKKIMVKDGNFVVLYAHISNVTKNKGDYIAINETLGAAASNNIQIEVVINNVCLVTTHGDMLDHAQSTALHKDWGGYLWDRIVKKFNLKVNQ